MKEHGIALFHGESDSFVVIVTKDSMLDWLLITEDCVPSESFNSDWTAWKARSCDLLHGLQVVPQRPLG
ncbi:unnamed protein product [Nesidiocoris tenuis]|uniref:Uncharacterized protein n=1 Tax=Nesidiocoris tenuis TaxID=355587 RepID=A0A6H5HGN6_9HEMI|nr:unnamed protein product [Nesidiocoris tenuis]